VKENREGDFVETVGRVELEYKREVAEWFRESIERPDDALLAYAVTTDKRETIREAERLESIEAAERALIDRINRWAARRKAPAPDADSHAAELDADKAANRSRSRAGSLSPPDRIAIRRAAEEALAMNSAKVPARHGVFGDIAPGVRTGRAAG
jgi:hypothetical protein